MKRLSCSNIYSVYRRSIVMFYFIPLKSEKSGNCLSTTYKRLYVCNCETYECPILLQNIPFLLCVSLLYLVYSSFWCMALKLMQLLNDIHNSNPFSFSLCENLLTFHSISFCCITLDEIESKLVFSWWNQK